MEPENFDPKLTRTVPTKEDQQNQLLLLGLQLLQKNLKLPCAVVKPRQQPPKQSGKDEEPDSSLVNSRKRKRTEEVTVEDKREKRLVEHLVGLVKYVLCKSRLFSGATAHRKMTRSFVCVV